MFNKIELPYATNALEPYIDAKTVEIHYGKHLQSYLENLNQAIETAGEIPEDIELEKLLANPEMIPEGIRQYVINQGGGVYNHNLYFSILSPNPKKKPEGALLDAINKAFGDFEGMKNQLSEAAITQFGSGYGMLVKNATGELFIKKTLNQNTTLPEGLIPILNIDVWEHAYYLQYQNLRAQYVEKIWDVIDWAVVEKLYEK